MVLGEDENRKEGDEISMAYCSLNSCSAKTESATPVRLLLFHLANLHVTRG